MSDLTRRYPFTVRPAYRESLDSFTRRTLQANLESPVQEKHLRSLAAIANPPRSWESVLAAKTGRDLTAREPVHNQNQDCWCASCNRAARTHVLCLLCAGGALVEQRPHLEENVCIRHRRWTGPNVPLDRQITGGRDLVEAERIFRRLRKLGRMNAPLYSMLNRSVIVHPLPTDTAAGNPIRKYAAMMQIAKALTHPTFIRQLFDPSRPFAASYALLTTMIETTLPTTYAFVTRKIWLYLRPSFLSIREALTMGHPYTRASAHDFIIPAEVAQEISTLESPSEPFERYLLPSGDGTISRNNCADIIIHRTPEAEAALALNDNNPVPTICREGHRTIQQTRDTIRRANRGTESCRICSTREILTGYNDLAATFPNTAAWWHPTKNSGLDPKTIAAGSNKQVWWLCPAEHEIQNTVGNMTRDLSCKHCRRAARPNLAYRARPDVIAQLDVESNPRLEVLKITVGSKERADWVCAKFHKFDQRVDVRANSSGCPICNHRRLARGFNDAASQQPILCKEWHPFLNGFVTPDSIFPGTTKFHWKCLLAGHSYIQSVPHRVKSRGCPKCDPEDRILNLPG